MRPGGHVQTLHAAVGREVRGVGDKEGGGRVKSEPG